MRTPAVPGGALSLPSLRKNTTVHVTLMSPRARTRSARAVAAVGAGGLLLSGCGTGSTVSSGNYTTASLRAKLPKAVRAAGVLKIGSNLNYAPVDFKDQNSTPAGIDPELAAAIGGYLGLRVQFVDMPFDKLIPAVQAKQIDLAMSAVIDTQQRQNGTDDNGRRSNPGVDFIDYLITGTSILVKAGNPLGIGSLDDICGHTVAVQRGTIQDEIAQRQTAACQKTSKGLRIDELDADGQALAEVASGAAAADLNDYPVAAYNTQSGNGGGQFQLTGGQLEPGPYGITLNKADSALRDVLAKALDQLIHDGDYGKILTKWNVSPGAVQGAVVNGGL
ncbi:ABC transporter substrate-binding protein [Kitasatospora kazusensis]|uniref:ABC transporter substrate-binding protein n=1 Tax=Kitasatospora kazusensis TaxID=407974 RepID=A0ABP5LF93_9ACTN